MIFFTTAFIQLDTGIPGVAISENSAGGSKASFRRPDEHPTGEKKQYIPV